MHYRMLTRHKFRPERRRLPVCFYLKGSRKEQFNLDQDISNRARSRWGHDCGDIGRPAYRERHYRGGVYDDYAYDRRYRGGCRTVTIDRDNGSRRTIRRCD